VPTIPYSEHAVPSRAETFITFAAVANVGIHVTEPAAPKRVHVPVIPLSEHAVPTAFCDEVEAEMVSIGDVQPEAPG
jgi:hypothetical protein